MLEHRVCTFPRELSVNVDLQYTMLALAHGMVHAKTVEVREFGIESNFRSSVSSLGEFVWKFYNICKLPNPFYKFCFDASQILICKKN